MCKYMSDSGICEIAGVVCEQVVICSEDGVWVDKPVSDATNNSNGETSKSI